jgi:hypothetical protein
VIEPIISTFSTYQEKDKKRSSGVVEEIEWKAKRNHALGMGLEVGEDENSSKTSMSSFEANTSGAGVPKRVASPEPVLMRHVGSREGLVRYGHGSRRGGDDIV